MSAWLAERGARPTVPSRSVMPCGAGPTPSQRSGRCRATRDALDTDFRFDTVADTELKEADSGLTEKALHRLADGGAVSPSRCTYQPRIHGAARRCASPARRAAPSAPFCATGELGFGRDLEVAEIVDRSVSRRVG
jgi:adenine C2-methylase RlmN of 23S rRNA A2503 and tRNA A37